MTKFYAKATPKLDLESSEEAAAIGHGIPKKVLPIGVVLIANILIPEDAFASLAVDKSLGNAVGAIPGLSLSNLGLASSTCACGTGLTNVGNNLSHATDGILAISGDPLEPIHSDVGIDTPLLSNINDTELTIATKDVVVVLSHGLCVVNGAAATMMKSGK